MMGSTRHQHRLSVSVLCEASRKRPQVYNELRFIYHNSSMRTRCAAGSHQARTWRSSCDTQPIPLSPKQPPHQYHTTGTLLPRYYTHTLVEREATTQSTKLRRSDHHQAQRCSLHPHIAWPLMSLSIPPIRLPIALTASPTYLLGTGEDAHAASPSPATRGSKKQTVFEHKTIVTNSRSHTPYFSAKEPISGGSVTPNDPAPLSQ
ncbi:hypothetical protein E2C01_082695 [Portunus trituberculatus]|uniref:Uncharacterized protein n=1 Tax=Portunus trituberculatus TaxID=210409 RepID=A0A5B7J4G3_PORTR|nr:hypothetical protein [Portunus trituberculatus]